MAAWEEERTEVMKPSIDGVLQHIMACYFGISVFAKVLTAEA